MLSIIRKQLLKVMAPGGIAVFIECLTDNNNRTVSAVRAAFNRHGGNLGTNGSLSFLFDRKGIFSIKNEGFNIEDIELDLIDAGAEDFEVRRRQDNYYLCYGRFRKY